MVLKLPPQPGKVANSGTVTGTDFHMSMGSGVEVVSPTGDCGEIRYGYRCRFQASMDSRSVLMWPPQPGIVAKSGTVTGAVWAPRSIFPPVYL